MSPHRAHSLAHVVYFQPRGITESPNATEYQLPQGFGRRFQLTLLSPRDALVPEPIAARAKVMRLDCSSAVPKSSVCTRLRSAGQAYRAIRRLVQCGRVDALVTASDEAGLLLGWRTRARLGIPWLACCWDHPFPVQAERAGLGNWGLRAVRNTFLRRTLRSADLLITFIHPGIISALKVQPRRVLNLLNGVDLDQLRDIRLRMAVDDRLIGVVANVDEKKGSLDVLYAFAVLRSSLPSARLRFIGEVSGHFAFRFAEEIARLGLQNVVEVLGWQPYDRAMELAAECNIMVYAYPPLPRFRWNYVLKIGEYFALGKPVVAVDTPGARGYVQDGHNGMLVPPRSPEAMASAIFALMRDPAAWDKMSRAAIATAEACSWDTVHDRIAEAVCRLCATHRQ